MAERMTHELRAWTMEPHFTRSAHGSVLVRAGKTMVLCTVSAVAGVPPHRIGKGGWLTAEYAMLPGSTRPRAGREGLSAKSKGRSREIERLIGRSLRAAVDLEALGELTLHVDTDVLDADGGTRTAAINGAFVALVLALGRLEEEGRLARWPLLRQITAVSCAWCDGAVVVDPDYAVDVRADVDLNVVMAGEDQLIEVQGTAEQGVMPRAALDAMVAAALSTRGALVALQRDAAGLLAARLPQGVA